MKTFVIKTLQRLQHIFPSKPQYVPHSWTVPNYDTNRQYAKLPVTSPLLNKSGIKRVQSIVGSFLYYRRTIDNTILVALNELAASQSVPTEQTNYKIIMLLGYLSTYLNTKFQNTKSDMILHLDSDAVYVVAPKARSKVARYFYCGRKNNNTIPSRTHLNGPIHIECKTLKYVVASAAEAKTAGLFHNCQTAVHIRNMLTVLSHLQPTTPAKTDNSTASSFFNDTLKKKRSKVWDVRYHWLSDQSALNKFLFIGIREPTIMLIITQSITLLRITLIHGRNMS